MKRILAYLLSLAMSQTLLADDGKAENFSLFADYNQLAQAKFRNPNHRHRRIKFSEERALGTYTHLFDEKNGLTVGAGYLGTQFHFSHRPKFDQKHFDNLLIDVGGFTREVEKWHIEANALAQINTEEFSLSRYTFLTGLLHGAYKWHSKRNLHVGVVAYTGMRYSRMLPVVGMDYTHSEKWKFNLVFPLNVSAVYSMDSNWSCEGALRYFLTRQRLEKDDRIHRGLVAYRNWGAEIGLNYRLSERIYFNAHVGESIAGRMRVSNHEDRHRHHYKIKPAPYFGLVAKIDF